jgi:hypothetical protein
MAKRLGVVGSVLVASVLQAAAVSAQTAPPEAPPPAGATAPPPMLSAPARPRENSINGSPLGLLSLNYALNYERLVDGMHGFLLEGVFSLSSNSTSKSSMYGGGAGYRWHWSGQQQSGFLGLMAGYSVGSGTSTVTSGGTTSTFDLTIKAPWVVANIGKRWAWDSGLNVTFRIGAGWAGYKVSSNSMDPNVQMGVDALQDLLELIPIALDGELSVGYIF